MHPLKLIICCFTLLTAFAFVEASDKESGSFIQEISFEDQGKLYKLQLTGEAIRKKFFVSVYEVGHYLEKGTVISGTNKFQAILNDDKIAKQLTFKWLRDVGADKIKDGYREAFKNSLSDSEFKQLQSQINQFLGYFNQEAKKGDEYIFRWLPGGRVEIRLKYDSIGTIDTPFARALWAIWLGDKSVVDRNKLLKT